MPKTAGAVGQPLKNEVCPGKMRPFGVTNSSRRLRRRYYMCGIAGWMGRLTPASQIGSRVARALRHRGPDATGVKSWDDATLIHTRLSIIDLSPTGAQPMANEDGTIWTVFNGEIYNHRQLRQDLAARGHRFVSRSDTEVL